MICGLPVQDLSRPDQALLKHFRTASVGEEIDRAISDMAKKSP